MSLRPARREAAARAAPSADGGRPPRVRWRGSSRCAARRGRGNEQPGTDRDARAPSLGGSAHGARSGPSRSTVAAAVSRETPQSSRQSGSARMASGSTPSAVTPETDAAGPALAVRRVTGRTASTPGSPRTARWCGAQDGDERAQVLAHDDVGRHGEGRLVALAGLERRAVRLREAGERHGEREERGRDPRRSRGAGERDPGQACAALSVRAARRVAPPREGAAPRPPRRRRRRGPEGRGASPPRRPPRRARRRPRRRSGGSRAPRGARRSRRGRAHRRAATGPARARPSRRSPRPRRRRSRGRGGARRVTARSPEHLTDGRARRRGGDGSGRASDDPADDARRRSRRRRTPCP